MPLWLGAAPFGLAYAVTARAAGLSIWETQFMSLAVFAGGAQFSAAGLFGVGASAATILLTTFLLNARHLLYGLSLGRSVALGRSERLVAAYFLTDEAYGVSVAAGATSFPFVLGAELSMFVVWNSFTLIGALIGQGIPDPVRLGVDFVFPLAFLALLIPLLQTRIDLLVAGFAGLLAVVGARLWAGGVAVLVAGIGGSLVGAWLTRGEE
ncbi:MAG: AzlC family ABC transporter permease [Herpetosiphonaceae bacterium]|nr:AzlC family ABC transporter permease [Herpetosiphonaceae bacterium]